MTEQKQTCSRCGAEKSLSEFRPYYNNRKGHYTYCKECEKLEARRKYLNNKAARTEREQYELDMINKLYAMRIKQGLKVPISRSAVPDALSIVERQIAEMHAHEDL